jgi:hypothetical protein
MQRDDERDDEQNADEPETIEQAKEPADELPREGAIDSAGFQDFADASGGKRSLGEELRALRELEAAAASDDTPLGASSVEASAIDLMFDDAGAPSSPLASGAESMSASSSTGSNAADVAAEPPPLSFLGPIKQLDDLPQHDIEHLDEETAASLVQAIRNPEKFEPGYLDRTTIRNLYSTMPSKPEEPGDTERPWYHSQLPPLRLEVTLLKYDWMVDKAIERAAGRIDRVTDQKIDAKVNSAKFELRNEIRNLLR